MKGPTKYVDAAYVSAVRRFEFGLKAAKKKHNQMALNHFNAAAGFAGDCMKNCKPAFGRMPKVYAQAEELQRRAIRNAERMRKRGTR